LPKYGGTKDKVIPGATRKSSSSAKRKEGKMETAKGSRGTVGLKRISKTKKTRRAREPRRTSSALAKKWADCKRTGEIGSGG